MSAQKRKYEIVKRPKRTLKLQCDTCAGSTWHSTLASARWREEVDEKFEEYDHSVLLCDGCEGASFRDYWAFGLPGNEPAYVSENFYPVRRDTKARRKLQGAGALPARVKAIYGETFAAINGGSPLLAGIGVRALVESVCKQKRIRGNNLKARIDGLANAGLLGRAEAKILHRIRFLGNKAAHEMKEPTAAELGSGMDIAEHLLVTVFLLPKRAKQLPTRGR